MGLITDNIDEPMHETVKIIFKQGIPVNLSALFSNCVNLVKIEKFLDLDLIREKNTPETSVKMFNIFYNCHSLCDICSIHPRYFEWFANIKEGGIGLCCEEAARIILSQNIPFKTFETEIESDSLLTFAEFSVLRMF